MVKLRLLMKDPHTQTNARFVELSVEHVTLEWLIDHGYFIDKFWATAEKGDFMSDEVGPVISMSD